VARGDSVCFLSVSGALGGAERVLVDLVASLRAADAARSISVVVAAGGPLVDALRSLGAEVLLLPMPASLLALGDSPARNGSRSLALLSGAAPNAVRLVRYVLSLRRVLRARRPGIVHSNGFKMHVLGALARPSGARLIWHLHDYTSPRAVMARVLRLLAARCSAAIANSRSVALDAVQTLGPRLRVHTVYNAVDLDRFERAIPADLAGASGLAPEVPGTVRIGMVATMARWKGHDVFLRALARLPRDRPWRAYVVGAPVYDAANSQRSLDELRTMARELELSDRIGFTGFVPDVSGAMAALDVVVHASSEPEPFGLVIAEAMAAGRAVVVSAAGGAAELVEEFATALTFAPRDVDGLANCMERLVADGALRERLGAAARRAAEERFDRGRFGAEVAAVYDGVVRGRA
jgi:glycosyltransferase involved in cell wall biosynthesis